MEKLGSGVYSIKVGYVRMFVIDGDEGITLIDTGLPNKEDRVLEGLRSMGRSPSDVRAIMLTHSHADHAGSASALKGETGATVFASEVDAPAIRGDEPSPPPPVFFRFPFLKPLARMGANAVGIDVDRFVSEGMRLPGDLTAYETPGHTEGHISYLLDRGNGVLFVGDAAAHRKGTVVRGFFNAPTTTIDASIRRLAALKFELACFGHSPALGEARQAFRAFG